VKKSFSVAMRVLISFGLLGLLVWIMKDDLGGIWPALKEIKNYLPVAAFLVLVNIYLQAYRLKIIFEGEDLDLTLLSSLRLTFIGSFFNNFMPTAVGGDIVKAHYASRINGEKLKSYASVMMDRLIGLYTFVAIAAVSCLVYRGRIDMPAIKPAVIGITLAGIAGYFVITHKKIAVFLEKAFFGIKMMGLGKKLNDIYEIVQDYRNRKDVVTKSFVTSVMAQGIYFFTVFFFFRALGGGVSLGDVFLIMPIVTFLSMVPSLGGLGVREGAIVALFTPIAGKDISFAVSLLVFGGLLFISIIGGIIYFLWNIRGIGAEKKLEGRS